MLQGPVPPCTHPAGAGRRPGEQSGLTNTRQAAEPKGAPSSGAVPPGAPRQLGSESVALPRARAVTEEAEAPA